MISVATSPRHAHLQLLRMSCGGMTTVERAVVRRPPTSSYREVIVQLPIASAFQLRLLRLEPRYKQREFRRSAAAGIPSS